MSRIYKSHRGKEVDLERLTLINENLPAVGNAKMNTRGDIIGAGGKIAIVHREWICNPSNRWG